MIGHPTLTIESFSARAMFGFGPISTQRQSFLGAKLTLMMSTPKTIRDLDLDLFVKRIKKSPGLLDTGQHFRYRKLWCLLEATYYEEICCDLLISTGIILGSFLHAAVSTALADHVSILLRWVYAQVASQTVSCIPGAVGHWHPGSVAGHRHRADGGSTRHHIWWRGVNHLRSTSIDHVTNSHQ